MDKLENLYKKRDLFETIKQNCDKHIEEIEYEINQVMANKFRS